VTDQISERPCPVCGSNHFWPVSFVDQATEHVVRRTHGYHWRLCKRCGNSTPSQVARREELQAYWEKNRIEQSQFEVTDAVWDRRLAESKIWGRRTYDFVSPWVRTNSKRFLDVGCGLGGTVAAFASHGWSALGLDPDPNAKQFHEHQGVETIIARIEEATLEPFFDVIGVAHAIYFIEEPKEFVRKMRSLLSPRGLFSIVSSHLFSALHIGRPGFVHAWYPTKSSLVYLLNQEGFELIASQTMKGSDMLLFQAGKPSSPQGRPWQALWMHRTQGLRHRTLGTILRAGLNGYRAIRKCLPRH